MKVGQEIQYPTNELIQTKTITDLNKLKMGVDLCSIYIQFGDLDEFKTGYNIENI